MKKNVIVFGLISGGIVATWMIVSMAFDTEHGTASMLLGFTGMILALSLVFVGVKNYRDKQNNGFITFGTALKMGLGISLIASTMYVIAWLIDYYVFIPDFMDKFSAQMIREAHASGGSAAEVNAKVAQAVQMKEMYKSPLMVVLYTYLEILPVALIVPLISALILKKKDNDGKVAMV